MKKIIKKISVLSLMLVLFLTLASCGGNTPTPPVGDDFTEVDYVSELKLDMNTSSLKAEVTVKSHIDGDTTHFYVDKTVNETGVLKARYLAINTPESTGKIEEWGKAASKFTKEKLSNATSIIIESDNEQWNLDSTGDRYLVWVWYKTSEDSDYRNLNLEILQNGFAIASNSRDNRYGETCVSAIDQAKRMKLHVHSNDKDPDFPYGEATVVTLKELRCNIKEYEGQKVAFEGVITKVYGEGAYFQSYDEETGLYYGIMVYYGFNLSGEGLEFMSVGNHLRVVGSVQYYETGGTYQVSGIQHMPFKPDNPDNLKLLGTNQEVVFTEINADEFKNNKVNVEVAEGEIKEFSQAELIMNTAVCMKNLKVKHISTTDKEDSSSKGAMTLTCEVDGITVSIRTVVLYDEDKNLITAEMFEGKTIDVVGIVDYFMGGYQVKVFSIKDIIIH